MTTPSILAIANRTAARPASPHLFGIFYEDLNHAGEGGICAELVQNRTFNHPDPLTAWSLLHEGGAEGSMGPGYSPGQAPANRNAVCPWALRLNAVEVPAGGRVGVANAGFWGVPVQAGAHYRLTIDTWHDGGAVGPLSVSVETRDGRVIAQGMVDGLTAERQRLTCTLTATVTAADGRLVLAIKQLGTVWFDFVSLCPVDTFRARPDGLRRDLAELVDGLRPSFMRFPGGCFVEGDRMEQAFRWKESLGDPARRPGHWNRWSYHSGGGLGFHEYLLMCEEWGAEALFVVNAGMSHTDTVPEDALPALIQDTVDAIEYANGPIDSVWGAKRAAAGHPSPFALRWIEIGNENGGPVYLRNYPLFRAAIKAKYPDIQVIADVIAAVEPGDLIDEHWFGDVAHLVEVAAGYDRAVRGGPQVYVGEYACVNGAGIGNLRAALAESALMTSFERNSDHVVMASYAPLLVRVEDRHWEVDAIGFDGTRAYPTVSYHAQRLFSLHRCRDMLTFTLTGAPPLPGRPELSAVHASVGRAADGTLVLKVVNLDTAPFACTIELAAPVAAQGEVIVLTAASLEDGNSLNHPRRVEPRISNEDSFSGRFTRSFPAGSLTILRLRENA